MLAPLDNETIFKKTFADKDVFQTFVKDLFNIDIIVDIIETEKKFETPLSPINFELDIYAETSDHNFIIEIQKIDYDHNFDSFLHNFLVLIANQQRSSIDYRYMQRVLGVVIFTRPYSFNTKDGQPIRDSILVMDFNPRNLKGDLIELYEHNIVFMNPSKEYQNDATPKRYQDWLDLFYASMKEPLNYKLNLNNKGIAQAVQILDYDKLDPETLRKMKETEMKKENEILIERDSKIEGRNEERNLNAINGIMRGYPNNVIYDLTGLTDDKINELRKQLNR